jgi:glycosyltransferase involved in cell wall biosynthesis
VDLNLFLRDGNEFKSFNADPITFVYSGSLGGLYLIGEMLDLYAEACQIFPQARFLLLTRSSLDLIQREMKVRAISPERITIRAVEYGEMPRWLNTAHVSLAFYRAGFSGVGRCPTKVGEYLACGLPVVINRGVGDTEEIFRKKKVGVVIDSYTPEVYRSALSTLEELFKDPDLAVRCRETALEFFPLKLGLDRYWDIYRQLAT